MATEIRITIFALLFIFTGCNSKIAEPEPVVVCEPIVESITVSHRPWQERTAAYENVGLKHPTLYLEGPLEKKGSNDGYFKTWDKDSAISFGVSPVIFVGNVIAWPVRMVQTPPWETQISRSNYPIQQPAHALAAKPSRAASKNGTHHEGYEEHEDF